MSEHQNAYDRFIQAAAYGIDPSTLVNYDNQYGGGSNTDNKESSNNDNQSYGNNRGGGGGNRGYQIYYLTNIFQFIIVKRNKYFFQTYI